MKILYLVRHAKAISPESGINDFKRSLSKQGREDAEAMGKRLRKKGIAPDLLISSPADRALETAHIFAKQFDYPVQKVLLKDEIYDEDAEVLKEILKQLDDRYNTIMLFGHEPALSQLAGFFLQDTETELRKTGVLGISLETQRWQEMAEKTGNLLLFDFPVRATPKVYRKARKEIAKEITATMEDILENIDVDASKHLDKIIEKTSKKLAKELTKVLQASKVEDIAGARSQERVDNLKVVESQETTGLQAESVEPSAPSKTFEAVDAAQPSESSESQENTKPTSKRRTRKKRTTAKPQEGKNKS